MNKKIKYFSIVLINFMFQNTNFGNFAIEF